MDTDPAFCRFWAQHNRELLLVVTETYPATSAHDVEAVCRDLYLNSDVTELPDMLVGLRNLSRQPKRSS